MVAAGVFLVARTYPIFQVSNALPFVAAIGATTALGAALIACTQFDIKRILAYSTLSQLGFMVAALGIGGWVAALFHLLTHAFFKALLFLGSGSIIHGMEATVGHDSNTAQDIRNMGGLRRFMPWTFGTYMAGYLALVGFPGFAGFWSKDEILADAYREGTYIILGALLIAAFLTAFYMTRQVALVFFGEFRGHAPLRETQPSEPKAVEQGRAEEHVHTEGGAHVVGGHDPHESPWTMVAPLVVLAGFAVFAGFANTPFFHGLSDYLGQEAGEFNVVIAGGATILTLAGMAAGWLTYRRAFVSAQETDPLATRVPGIFSGLNQRLGFDELYADTVGWLTNALARAWSWLDQRVFAPLVIGVDRIGLLFGEASFIVDDAVLNDGVDRLADGTIEGGNQLRRSETGKIQDYLGLLFGGAVVLGIMYLYAFR
jgi:NADH-quinone oxidoreductase subunit L